MPVYIKEKVEIGRYHSRTTSDKRTSITKLVGFHHAENGPIHRKTAVDCPPLITSIVKILSLTRPGKGRNWSSQPFAYMTLGLVNDYFKELTAT